MWWNRLWTQSPRSFSVRKIDRCIVFIEPSFRESLIKWADSLVSISHPYAIGTYILKSFDLSALQLHGACANIMTVHIVMVMSERSTIWTYYNYSTHTQYYYLACGLFCACCLASVICNMCHIFILSLSSFICHCLSSLADGRPLSSCMLFSRRT